MKLYHGSTIDIERIDLALSKPNTNRTNYSSTDCLLNINSCDSCNLLQIRCCL